MSKKSKQEILVVDDSPVIRRMLVMNLEKCGYKVFQATDGQDALNIIDKKLPGCFSIIITDYDMPVMNGKDLIAKLRSSAYSVYNKTNIIMCSAEKSYKTEDLEADYFIHKPYDMHTIFDCIAPTTQAMEEKLDIDVLGDD